MSTGINEARYSFVWLRSQKVPFSFFSGMSNMLPLLKFMKIYVFMPKNEFHPFSVSCFMNFHHPFMFDNFSPFSAPRAAPTGFMETKATLGKLRKQFRCIYCQRHCEPICSRQKFNQLQFVGICFSFNTSIFFIHAK